MRKFYLALLLFVLAVSGCATPGVESYRLGLELEKQDRLEESFCMLEEAVAKAQDNTDYNVACDRVRTQLMNRYLSQTRTLLETKPVTFGSLQLAQASVGRALKLDKLHQEAVKLNETIERQINEMTPRAEKLFMAAELASDANEWRYALDQLQEIQSFYPEYPGLTMKIPAVVAGGVAYYQKKAEELATQDDLSNAIAMLVKAQELDPAGQVTAAMLAELRSRHSPENYLSKAAEFAKQREWGKAVSLMQKAKSLQPGTEAVERMEKLQKEAASYFLEKGVQEYLAGNFYAAYGNVISAQELRADIGRDPKAVEFTANLTEAVKELAEGYENSGRLGNALLWYEKAHQLAGGGNRGLYPKIQAIKDKIRQRVVKKIAVMDFHSPSSNQDAGRLVADRLLSYLAKNASRDVKIFARDVLGALLKEYELGMGGVIDIESAKKAGKLKGTDVLIVGNVNQCGVEKSVDEGLKMVNAVVGKKQVLNPAYQAWSAINRSPTEMDLAKAPPQLIEEELREIVKYKVATHKKIANVVVSFRLIDVEEGEVVLTKTLPNTETATDTYSEGVDWVGIPFKPLNLPSDSALLEQVVEKTVTELGYGVLSRFQNLQVVYANSAEMIKKKGDYEQAVEKFVDTIHVEEVKNISTQISENARREVDQLLQVIAAEKAVPRKPATPEQLQADGSSRSMPAEEVEQDRKRVRKSPKPAPVKNEAKPAADLAKSVADPKPAVDSVAPERGTELKIPDNLPNEPAPVAAQPQPQTRTQPVQADAAAQPDTPVSSQGSVPAEAAPPAAVSSDEEETAPVPLKPPVDEEPAPRAAPALSVDGATGSAETEEAARTPAKTE